MGYFKNIINDINRVSDALPESSANALKTDAVSDDKNINNNTEINQLAYENIDSWKDINIKMNGDGLHAEKFMTKNRNEDGVASENSSVFYEDIHQSQENNPHKLSHNGFRFEKKDSIELIPVNELDDFENEKNKQNKNNREDESLHLAELRESSGDISIGDRYTEVDFKVTEKNNVLDYDESHKENIDPVSNENVNTKKFKNNIKDNASDNLEIDAADIDHQYKNSKDEEFKAEVNKKNTANGRGFDIYAGDDENRENSRADLNVTSPVPENRDLDLKEINKSESYFYANEPTDARLEYESDLQGDSNRPVYLNERGYKVNDNEKSKIDINLKGAIPVCSKNTEVNREDKISKSIESKYAKNESVGNKAIENVPMENIPMKNIPEKNISGKKGYSNQSFLENENNKKIPKEFNYKATGKKPYSSDKVDKYRSTDKPDKSKNKTSNTQKTSKHVPDVIIGQIDIRIEAPPAPAAQSDSSTAMFDLSSRYYLRRL